MLADLVLSRETLGVNRRCDVHKHAIVRQSFMRLWRKLAG
ncbi:hypothetical protein SAMN04515647_1774 [Cohaesibacter sp. ES.047]|nr:hypothetical protein SAMN04515647_1774 [Cohaesibacter sp. ES.047]